MIASLTWSHAAHDASAVITNRRGSVQGFAGAQLRRREASTHWTCKHHPLFRFSASVFSRAGVLSDLKSSDLQRAIAVRALLLRL